MATGEFMSTIETNNNNKTVFNLFFDNGLPYKPVIRCETTLFTQQNNENAGIIHLELPNPSPIDERLDEALERIKLTIDKEEVFIDIGEFYIVGDHCSEFIWKSAEEKTLYVSIYKNQVFLAGARFANGTK
jgi:hypothetical protein